MYFDALTAAAVSDELKQTILGGFVQKAVLSGRDSVAFEVYMHHRRRYLLLDARGSDPRALLLSGNKPTAQPGLITPFGLLLRKYVLNGVVDAIEQPAGERIISLRVSKTFEDTRAVVWVQAELMGRHSNLLLLDESRQTVLESSKRVTPDMSRVRPVLPHKPYTPPPPREGIQPHRVTPQLLQEAVGASKGSTPLAQAIVRSVPGFSPISSREAIFRAGGDPDTKVSEWENWPALTNSIRELALLWATREWTPCVAEIEGGVAAYAPYELKHLREQAALDFPAGISEAIERYSGSSASIASHQQLRDQIIAALDKRAERLTQRLQSLQRERKGAEEAERLMEDGQMVLAYAYSIEPGATELALDDRKIALDPELTPAQNAQQMFDEYKRRRRAENDVPALMSDAQRKLDLVNDYRTYASLAEGYVELTQLRAEAIAAGVIRESSNGGKSTRKEAPGKLSSFMMPEGTRILVGKSAAQNAKVLDAGSPDDWWFHAREIPGGHVLARTGGRALTEEILRTASETAAWYSAYRNSPSVEVIYCQLRNVRKIKGSYPGHVTYRNERGINAKPVNHVE